jgi:hypothetical protein
VVQGKTRADLLGPLPHIQQTKMSTAGLAGGALLKWAARKMIWERLLTF